MKKTSQIYVLLIVLFLAVITFFLFAHKFKFSEGLYPTVDPTEDPTIGPTIGPTVDPEEDPEGDQEEDPEAEPEEDPTVDPEANYTITNKVKRGVGATEYTESNGSELVLGGNVITGQNISMDKDNKHSISSTLQGLEKDFDTDIPKIFKKISSIEKNVAKLEEYNKAPTNRVKITHATEIKKTMPTIK